MAVTHSLILADNAWLGPGHLAKRVLVAFDSRIQRVVELPAGAPVPDQCLRALWVVPGLVNAHCHLEYSWLADQLPRGSIPFGDWMNAIMGQRPTTPSDEIARTRAMADAARALVGGGCTTVLDSTTDGASEAPLRAAGLRFFLFREILGLSAGRAEPLWNAARTAVEAAQPDEEAMPPEDRLLGAGLNPHAPYSVGPWLREQLTRPEIAALPQAWHLAETLDEEALFQHGTGSIAERLTAFGLPLPTQEFGRSSFEYLQQEHLLESCDLAFHGNELSDVAARFFRAPRGLVHCPGTHRWFQRAPLPLRRWLDAGVNICLGTDSRASADTLSMLDVVRMTLADHPDLTLDAVLTMACVNPWKLDFLRARLPEATGTITPGAPADLVTLTPETATEPLKDVSPEKQFLRLASPGTITWCAGQRLN